MMKERAYRVKGCQRKVLVIKSRKSDLFEEAYFVLKPQGEEAYEDDMVREAERLIKESGEKTGKRRLTLNGEDVLLFCAGVAFSLVVAAVLALFSIF